MLYNFTDSNLIIFSFCCCCFRPLGSNPLEPTHTYTHRRACVTENDQKARAPWTGNENSPEILCFFAFVRERSRQRII